MTISRIATRWVEARGYDVEDLHVCTEELSWPTIRVQFSEEIIPDHVPPTTSDEKGP